MSRKLPPLNALRAFEAAGRHLSFMKAAAELNVTPAAISHQIKGLEDRLGTKLFRRAKRAIRLTEAGQACLPELRQGFDYLSSAMDRLKVIDESGPLTVSTAPSFAAKWLVPRLDRFRDRCPDVDVRLDASMDLIDFDRGDVDVGVRFGTGDYPGLETTLLLCEEVFPVCGPALLNGEHPLASPTDLRWQTLLHEDTHPFGEAYPDWRMWLHAAGVRDVGYERGPRFSGPELVVQAAIDGQGVALGRGVVVANDIAAGRLVKPFEGTYPVNFAYHVVRPAGYDDRPKVGAFIAWLMDEAKAHNAAGPDRQPDPAVPRVG